MTYNNKLGAEDSYTYQYYTKLETNEVSEIVELFELLANDSRKVLELVETNPVKYVSVIEHCPDCKELSLPLWTKRILGNLMVKFRLSENDRPIEVGFNDSSVDEEVLEDLRISIKYWLSFDEKQLAIQRRNIAMSGLDNELINHVNNSSSNVTNLNNNKSSLSTTSPLGAVTTPTVAVTNQSNKDVIKEQPEHYTKKIQIITITTIDSYGNVVTTTNTTTNIQNV